MSRGLGRMQRAILDACGRYRSEFPPHGYHWRGGEITPHGTMYCVSHGHEFNPPDDVIDMRAVGRWLAMNDTKFITPAWSAAFSRAVRGLVARGELVPANHSGGRFYRLKCYANNVNG